MTTKPDFQRRHYELVARVLKEGAYCFTSEGDHALLAGKFAGEFERDNSNFNRARFLEAAGVRRHD